ncbi:TetR/AcrR family transcriptional regulator [Nocardia aurea]|uniref:TetR/AcrR family transcriptional regulator n=1 Tax=Nocardia aurea TaxID=2144174 RepID=UPI000D685A48|nr:TetR/AcrR family transcriptional regulator [Nocardia aurea]
MPTSIRERKRRRAREAIIKAAFDLFATHGFSAVTVTEIAERAEVGRTTFFRYFGDKQEVVFADEQHMLDELLALEGVDPLPGMTLAQALSRARPAVRAVCAVGTRDAGRYVLYERLVADNPELHDRKERKLLALTDAMAGVLRAQGAADATAALAAHIALACFRTGRLLAGPDPAALTDAVDAAFAEVEALAGAGTLSR